MSDCIRVRYINVKMNTGDKVFYDLIDRIVVYMNDDIVTSCLIKMYKSILGVKNTTQYIQNK